MATKPPELEREDALLLLLAALSESGAKRKVASVTRLEKMTFLLQEETSFARRLKDKFKFEPWKFGPFSKGVYEALDLLSSLGFIDVEERELANYMEYTEQDQLMGAEENEPVVEKVFSLTERGKRVAEKLRTLIRDEEWAEIVSLRQRFGAIPLTTLIQYVYQKYPETTGKSVLDHLKPR